MEARGKGVGERPKRRGERKMESREVEESKEGEMMHGEVSVEGGKEEQHGERDERMEERHGVGIDGRLRKRRMYI